MANKQGRERDKQPQNRLKRALKREKRRIDQTLRDKHAYIPPAGLHISEIESRDPTQLFTTVPCQICEATNCGQQAPGHGSPIVIDIRSKSRFPAACAIFFSRASDYNGTFLIHDTKLNRREIDLNTVILALRQIHAFMLANSEEDAPLAICINQIIIKTNSRWLDRRLFGGNRYHRRFKDLAREFEAAVDELEEYNGSRPLVKIWKVKGRTMAQQLAELKLERWEESQAQLEVQE
jgi:hypothetical protein